MVVEVLEMSEIGHCAQGVRADLRRTMSGDLQSVSSRQAARGEKAGGPAAARDVGLEAVDAAEQIAEVGRHVGVLAGRDLETGGRAPAEEPQAFQLRRADRPPG